MPVNYDAIKEENLVKYGTDIKRIGAMLLSDRYADRTHFIFEILQNTEDALKRRGGWTGQRAVNFSLESNGLTVSHFGKLFDEADVRGVCGIGESTKGLTDIGRFGIGFKSVYAYTDKPEIHSGTEHFGIDSYVWPETAKEISISQEETRIYLPFRKDIPSAKEEVLSGLEALGPRTLLFLREIEEISWTVDGTVSGSYYRSIEGHPNDNPRRVQIDGRVDDSSDVVEEWLVFSRKVFYERSSVGHVEVAFELAPATGNEHLGERSIKSVPDSKLVVFFPTEVSTSLGFLIQGPYQTTPSRDNIPFDRHWNQHLVQETAQLLVDALRELQKLGLLNVDAFRCLPLAKGGRFAALYEAVREALLSETLIPAYNGKHVAGRSAKLARTKDLRELIGINRLSTLFPTEDKTVWVSDEITQDRERRLYSYLTDDLNIAEVTPENLIPLLTPAFLEAQPDSWIKKLYEFLHDQRALLPRLRRLSLVRLENGSHTVPYVGESPQAYLPGKTPTDFPTVRHATCNSKKSREFLEALGLRTPDPVDDVIANILPRYSKSLMDIGSRRYPNDIERILSAYSSDSREQRDRLVKALNEVKFIAAVDMGNGEKQFARPRDIYMATERLTGLFKDVPGVLMADNSRRCLRGEVIRNFFRALETSEYLIPKQVETSLTQYDKQELRRKEGSTSFSQEKSVQDFTLMGLDSLLKAIGDLPFEEAKERAGLLWQALRNVQSNRGDQAFNGRYHWFWYTDRSAHFPAEFVHTLRQTPWVPNKEGVLSTPDSVVFDDTGWELDQALAAKFPFKPPIIRVLAKEAGINPEVIESFGKLDSSEQNRVMEFIESLSRQRETPDSTGPRVPSVPTPVGPVSPDGNNPTPQDGGKQLTVPSPSQPSTPLSAPREFVTYVKVAPTEPTEDPEGLTHRERMSLEEQAIQFILSKEPHLKRTPPNNPGYDLWEPCLDGTPVRWVEVKAMSGTLDSRSATLTKTQFEFAQGKQDSCWLYVVENAGAPSMSRIVKIKNPAGKAQTFTFDRGWVHLAE